MNREDETFDQNLKHLLEQGSDRSRPAFEQALVRDVLEELTAQRRA